MKFHYGPASLSPPKKRRTEEDHYVEPWPRDRSVGKRLGMDRRDFDQQVELEVQKRLKNGGYVDRAQKSEHRRLRKRAMKQQTEFVDEETLAEVRAPQPDHDAIFDCIAILDSLKPRHRAALFHHYLRGLTDAEVGRLLNVGANQAGRIRKAALEEASRRFPECRVENG